MRREPYDYYAFISYKREDEKWARWLQNALEGYRLPAIVHKENPYLPKRVRPIFRDKTDLGAGELTSGIRDKIESSRYLIVICSPASAKAKWISKEINLFKDLGRYEKIIPFIISGEPHSINPDTECLNPALIEKGKELLGINIKEIGKSQAFIKVVAGLLDLDFDILWQRHRRRVVKNRFLGTGLAAFFVGCCGYIWASNQAFDMTVHLHELSHHNAQLPLVKDSYVEIQFEKEWVRKEIESLKAPLIFHDIAAKYKGQLLPARLKSYGFTLTSPQIEASPKTSLGLTRDNTYAKVKGWVRDEASSANLAGVQVTIKGKHTTTDAEGRFELSLPLELQEAVYEITLTHKGKKHTFKDKTYPTKNDENFIIKYYLP